MYECLVEDLLFPISWSKFYRTLTNTIQQKSFRWPNEKIIDATLTITPNTVPYSPIRFSSVYLNPLVFQTRVKNAFFPTPKRSFNYSKETTVYSCVNDKETYRWKENWSRSSINLLALGEMSLQIPSELSAVTARTLKCTSNWEHETCSVEMLAWTG